MRPRLERYLLDLKNYRTTYNGFPATSCEFDMGLGPFQQATLGIAVEGTVSMTSVPASVYDLRTRPGSILLQPRNGVGNFTAFWMPWVVQDGETLVTAMSAPYGADGAGNNDVSYGVSLNDTSTGAAFGTFDQFHWDGGDGTIAHWNGTTQLVMGTDFTPGSELYWALSRKGDIVQASVSIDGGVWCPFSEIDTVARGHTFVWFRYAAQNLGLSQVAAPLEVRWVRHLRTPDFPAFPFTL